MDIVCVPDMDWDHLIWTNRQHVMYRLPKTDPAVRVLYVGSPRFALTGKLGRSGRLRQRTFLEGQRADGLWTQRIGDRLWVLQPLLPIPNRLLRRAAPRLLDAWTLAVVRSTMRRLGFERPVLWAYTPLAATFVGKLGERLVCYDVVDDYPALAEYRTLGARVTVQDRELTRQAGLVLVASRTVYEERKHLNPHCHFVGNAADVALFAQAQSRRLARPADLHGIRDPILGFHGTLTSSKLDLQLCRELALQRPDWSLVFVGPVQDETVRANLADLPNVHLLGAKEQAELPSYLAHFAVCIIPYRRNRYTERLNALKLYECLAAGRPIVATDLPCFRDVHESVAVADDAGGFTAAIERVLTGGTAPKAGPGPLAMGDFSWEAKISRMWELVLAAVHRADGCRGR